MYEYKPSGVCSSKIRFDVDGDDRLTFVEFVGGCSGNTQGIGKLAIGMKVDDVIEKLSGIRCGFKSTSCPDQFAQALKQFKEN